MWAVSYEKAESRLRNLKFRRRIPLFRHCGDVNIQLKIYMHKIRTVKNYETQLIIIGMICCIISRLCAAQKKYLTVVFAWTTNTQ